MHCSGTLGWYPFSLGFVLCIRKRPGECVLPADFISGVEFFSWQEPQDLLVSVLVSVVAAIPDRVSAAILDQAFQVSLMLEEVLDLGAEELHYQEDDCRDGQVLLVILDQDEQVQAATLDQVDHLLGARNRDRLVVAAILGQDDRDQEDLDQDDLAGRERSGVMGDHLHRCRNRDRLRLAEEEDRDLDARRESKGVSNPRRASKIRA